MERGRPLLIAIVAGALGAVAGYSFAPEPSFAPTTADCAEVARPSQDEEPPPSSPMTRGTAPRPAQSREQRAALPPDAGVPAAVTTPRCVDSILADHDAMLAVVRRAHDEARLACVGAFVPQHDQQTPFRRGPRDPCGPLSEELWNQAATPLSSFLEGMHSAAGQDRSMGQPLLAGVDCNQLGAEDFGAALHLATSAPDWTAPEFFRCALQREDVESFALWSVLSRIRGLEGARSLLPAREYRDERTLRRIERLGM